MKAVPRWVMLAAALLSSVATAQPWPSKPIRLVVPFPPGGSNDIVGRVVATHLSDRLDRKSVV